MMRTLVLFAVAAAFSLGAASSALAQREVRIYNWAGYLEPSIFEDFEEVRDNPSIYPDAETLANLFTVQAYPPRVQRWVTRAWTSIITGQWARRYRVT